jgi:hypothetical protein
MFVPCTTAGDTVREIYADARGSRRFRQNSAEARTRAEKRQRVDKTQGIRYNVPTVIREERYEVRIYTFDHPPPHVHVAKAGAIVRIDLATHDVTEIVETFLIGTSRAERLVARHAKRLKEEWAKLHEND